MQRSETVGRCGDPWEVGDEITIWSTSGVPQTTSPINIQIAMGVLVLGLAGAVALILHSRRKVIKQTTAAINGTWRPVQLQTVGMPGTKTFQIRSQQPLKNRPMYWTRVLYKSDISVAPAPTVPGTVYIGSIRRNKVRGLSLHVTSENTRMWHWHG